MATWHYSDYIQAGRPDLNVGDTILGIPDGQYMIYPIPVDNCEAPPCKIITIDMCVEPDVLEVGQWGCQLPYIWVPQHEDTIYPSQARLLDTSLPDPEISAYNLGNLTFPSTTIVDHINNCCYIASTKSPGCQVVKLLLHAANITRIDTENTSRINLDGTLHISPYPDPCLSWKLYFNGNGNYIETRYNELNPDYVSGSTIQEDDPLSNSSFVSEWAQSIKGMCLDGEGNLWVSFYYCNDIHKSKLYKFDRNGNKLLGPLSSNNDMYHSFVLKCYDDKIYSCCPRSLVSDNFVSGELPSSYPDMDTGNHVSGLMVYDMSNDRWYNYLPNDDDDVVYLYDIIINAGIIYGTVVGGNNTGKIYKRLLSSNTHSFIGNCGDTNTFLRGLCIRGSNLYIAGSRPGARVYKVNISNGRTTTLHLPDIPGDTEITGVAVDIHNKVWCVGLYDGFHVIDTSDVVEYRSPKNNEGHHYVFSEFAGRSMFSEEGRWLT